ncbi:MAG: DUF357 domain-containing protein [Nanoarchaeota archaeon]|nr:DUF357 domain-containing protein [Nanoarchaeota archaeon]
MKKKIIDKITLKKIEKYSSLTTKALDIAKKNISKNRDIESHEIIQMVEAYLSDSRYFRRKRDFVNSFGCLNYAHGWLDCGARLRIFEVSDNRLFTV